MKYQLPFENEKKLFVNLWIDFKIFNWYTLNLSFFIHQNFIIETSHLKSSPPSCNVQHTSDTSKTLAVHPFPNFHENLKLINDLVDTESVTLCNLWVKYKQGSVANNKKDFEKNAALYDT